MSILLSRGRFYKQWLFDRGSQFYQINLRNTSVGASAIVPAGLGFTRTTNPDSVQTGTSALVEIANASNILRYGRALDAWDLGLVLEEARTNLITYGRDFSNASWAKTTTGTPTYGGAVSPFGGATGATLVTVPITTGILAENIVTGATTLVTATFWLSGAAPNYNLYTNVSNDRTASPSGSVGVWTRVPSITRDASNGGSALVIMDGRDWTTKGGLAAAAHTAAVDAAQREAGAFPTEYIPTSGSTATRNATFLRALSTTWSPWLNSGRFSVELSFRAKGARTEYSSTPYLWYVDSSNYTSFVPSTGVLTIAVGGGTNTVTLPSWARYDLIDLSIQCGGNIATIVQYKLNSGSVVSLAITGTALGNMAGGTDMYLMSSNTAGHLSCWFYGVNFYRLGKPSWVTA